MGFNFKDTNLLNPETWTVGTSGSTGIFLQNGSTNENVRVSGTNPWGNTDVVWESAADGLTYGADGGWNINYFSVDPTKMYRYSCWAKKTVAGVGNFYQGIYGWNSINSNIGVLARNTGSNNTNYYWVGTGVNGMNTNQWYLFIGHIWPQNSGTGSSQSESGLYTGTTKLGSYIDCVWVTGTTSCGPRNYLYYSTGTTSTVQFYYPRLDVIDGTEPSIKDLLSGIDRNLLSTTITPEGVSFKNRNIIATGGTITYNGQWKIHTFTGSTTFGITSLSSGDELEIDYLMVAGGGGGGMDMGGGGGGGGVITGSTTLTGGTYSIVIGGGGAGAPAGGTLGQPTTHQFTVSAVNGSNTTFNGLTATGGGFGSSSYWSYTPNLGVPGNGGCGGGVSGYRTSGTINGGTGVSGQGFSGGTVTAGTGYYSGGGGGSGAVGTSNVGGLLRADGGAGKYSNILSRPYYWGGGGAGAGYSTWGGAGGKGGGGGASPDDAANNYAKGGRECIMWGIPGINGTLNTQTNKAGGNGGTNTGGGGGGGSHYNATNAGGNGGSGIVIIRYKYK